MTRKIISKSGDVTEYDDGTFDIGGEMLEHLEQVAKERGTDTQEAFEYIIRLALDNY